MEAPSLPSYLQSFILSLMVITDWTDMVHIFKTVNTQWNEEATVKVSKEF